MNPGPPERRGSRIPERIFHTEASVFRENFNRRAFDFSHALGDHPLFDLDRLAELAKTLWGTGSGRVACQVGSFGRTDRLDERPTKPLSIVQAISRIRESGSWVLLKSAQVDPDYAALLDRCLAELEALSGRALRREISWLDAYIFIASPGSLTPYHIDHECNFVLQIHGTKRDTLYDPSVLTAEDIERYYMGDLSGARWRQDCEENARTHVLTPGLGVHHPSRWPHWVQNGSDDYTVMLSVLFFLRGDDREARVWQMNHVLRRMGRMPMPPGQSAWRDRIKRLALARFPPARVFANKSDVIRNGVGRLETLERVLLRRPTVPPPGTPNARSQED